MTEASIKQRTRQAKDYSKEINTCYSSLAESRTRMRQCRKLAVHQESCFERPSTNTNNQR